MKDTHSTKDLGPYLETAFAACDGAAEILKRHYGRLKTIDHKYQAGLVSEADRESERYIIQTIRSRFPDHGFLGEESGFSAGSNDTLWMIDPLDGTTNYVHQFPFFCISIGLEIRGQLVVGVVDAPMLGARFHGVGGGGSYLNGSRISASSRDQIKDSLFATGFSAYDQDLDHQLALLKKIIRQARGVRRAGAAALDLCYVAQGVFDVFWERNLQPWDTAAGVLIAREAGAVVTDMKGQDYDPRMKTVLCANPHLHRTILSEVLSIQ